MKTESRLARYTRFVINNSPIRLDYRLNKYFFNSNKDYPELWYKWIGEVPTGKILDVGFGNRPFPPADTFVEKYLEPCVQNNWQPPIMPSNGQKVVVADAEALPFSDKEFDFVFCSHVLEHVDNPLQACNELMRVGKRGYIETPRYGTDQLMAWDPDIHKWLVSASGHLLIFTYMDGLNYQGICSTAFRDTLSSIWQLPLQRAYYDHPEVFNIMFNWQNSFRVLVIYPDGHLEKNF